MRVDRQPRTFWAAAWRFFREQALARLLFTHAAIGFGVAAVAVALMIGFDPGGIGRLLERAPPAIALLWFFMGLTCASVQMGMAVMELREGAQREDALDHDDA